MIGVIIRNVVGWLYEYVCQVILKKDFLMIS